MNKTPKWIKDIWAVQSRPKCARKGVDCSGKMTKEHALYYAGRQIQEPWAIIDLCWHHHLGAGLNKRMNEYLAIMRATPEDLAKYPRVDWAQKLSYLKKTLGIDS